MYRSRLFENGKPQLAVDPIYVKLQYNSAWCKDSSLYFFKSIS